MDTLNELMPVEGREISREEWQLRLRWAYELGRKDAAFATLKEVFDLRRLSAEGADQAKRAIMAYLEDKEKS